MIEPAKLMAHTMAERLRVLPQSTAHCDTAFLFHP
jgi:hypothetical protein